MALAASPVPSSVQESKLLPFRSSRTKNESDLWDSYEENGSSRGHHEEGLNPLDSMVSTLDQQQTEQEKHYPASTSGLSRNASFDSVTSHDSCTASFSTGSPVTVLPPLTYTSSGMGVSSSRLSAAGWANNFNSSNKRSVSSGLEAPEQQEQSQDSIFNTFGFHEQMLLSDDCEQLLASPVGTLPSMLEFPPFSRFDDQACASNCNEFSPVNELNCLLPTSHPMTDLSQQQAVKSPESVGNNNVHSPAPAQQQQQQQQQQEDFCQDFLVGDREVYSEHKVSGRSDASSLLPPPSARRRLSWTEYQVPEPPQRHSSTLDGLQQYSGFSSQAYDHQHHLPSVVQLLDNSIGADVSNVNVNPFRSGTVHDTLRLKRSYSTMMMQEPVPSTCSISSSAPASSFRTSNSYLKFAASAAAAAAAVPVPPVPKCVSNISPILPPPVTNLSHSSSSNNNTNQQDVAAFNALLYKTQGSSTSEMMQQLQQAQGQGTSSSSSDSAAAAAARPLPPPKLRRRHGTATDPQSIAARTRRERFSDRIRILQSLVPNGERLDTVSMLGHTLEYVRFLQHQVWQLYNGNDDAGASADSESREKWKEFMDAQTVVA